MSTEALRDKIKALMPQAKRDLAQMVAFRSVHDAAQFPPAECAGMVDWLLTAFTAAGLQDVRGYDTPDGSVAVCGHAAGPPGAPTVLLYFHHDVQPPLDDAAWTTPVWELTEVNGRWYGRGAADCKGNIAMHLTALRALAGELPVTIKIVGEGSEEQGTGGLEAFVPQNAELLSADAILVCDAGNFAVGAPSLTTSLRGLANVVVTVETLSSPMHSGMFGGAAPDALAALIAHAGHPARRARQHDRARSRREPDVDRRRLPRRSSSAPTPTSSTGSTCWGTAGSPTWCGRARPRRCSASTARPSWDPRPPSSRGPARGSTCGCRPAWTPSTAQDLLDRAPQGRRPVARAGRRRTRSRRRTVHRLARRTGLRRDDRGDGGRVRPGRHPAGPGRVDPAVQRLRRTPSPTPRSC